MSKNPIINIVPKVKDNIIKDENFTNAKKSSLLLETKSIDEIIFDSIKKNFDLLGHPNSYRSIFTLLDDLANRVCTGHTAIANVNRFILENNEHETIIYNIMNFINKYISNSKLILDELDLNQISTMISILKETRENNGRLFILGVGGGAGHASHAVNDFRKLAGIETYSPAENIAEITARTNDEGWHTVFSEWLKCSHINEKDAVMVFSVGGGNKEKNVSANIVYALDVAKSKNARVLGILGRDGGHTAKIADACVIVPPVNPETITPHSEAFQGVIWHLIVADPRLMQIKNKWESP